jgi:streptogramin lyase
MTFSAAPLIRSKIPLKLKRHFKGAGASRHCLGLLVGGFLTAGAFFPISVPAQSLYVASQGDSGNGTSIPAILRFDAATDAFESVFVNGSAPVGIAFGPDGDLFVAEFQDGYIARYDGTTGAFKTKISGSELKNPLAIITGPGGDLFVSDNSAAQVLRYDGRSGAFKGVFASGGGLKDAWYMTFGPDGDLYVSSNGTGEVMRYNGTTGAFKAVFASGGELIAPYGLAFGPDGNLYVSSGDPFGNARNQPILRFDGQTGDFIDEFTSGQELTDPDYIVFGPDGDLYVGNYGTSEVFRFDGSSGAFKSVAASNDKLGPTGGITFTPAAKVLNISTRLPVQTGDNVLIVGFIVTGTQPKQVLVRAIGPSLTAFGVQGALSDPTLELHDGTGALLAFNDDWKQTQQAEIQATGIAPSNDLESAIARTLAPGNYTAVVRGKNNSTGIGVVEAYDLNQAETSKLANISSRGFVSTDDNVIIAGFIVRPGGGTGTEIVVRAIGPSLSKLGVSGALQDPTLELHNSNGATIGSNDDWKDSQQSAIEATGLQPSDDRESAFIASLVPGAYTAVVRGKNNTTGVGLVELYNLN